MSSQCCFTEYLIENPFLLQIIKLCQPLSSLALPVLAL